MLASHKFRITPAYAGKTTWSEFEQESDGDHPRLRGENSFIVSVLIPVRGSPPPTRGKLDIKIVLTLNIGITPAYAGKTARIWGSRGKKRDHPRLRGENAVRLQPASRSGGSPPPTRGKRRPAAACKPLWRITPAYAGKTQRPFPNTSISRDHPRLRGENT